MCVCVCVCVCVCPVREQKTLVKFLETENASVNGPLCWIFMGNLACFLILFHYAYLFIGFYLSSNLLFQSLRKIGFGKQVYVLFFSRPMIKITL